MQCPSKEPAPFGGRGFFMRHVKHLRRGNYYVMYNPNYKEVLVGKCNYDNSIDLTWGVSSKLDKDNNIWLLKDLLDEYPDGIDDVFDSDQIFKLNKEEILQHVVAEEL
jgi:hypothetical protein